MRMLLTCPPPCLQDQIKIPLLCINAMNDPLICSSLIPYDLPAKNHNVILATTGKGGHLAWCVLLHACRVKTPLILGALTWF